MSDYLRLLPSGLAVASGDDTFLTQLMNDNIRRMEKQLPCCCRIRVNDFLPAGSPVGLVGTTPPTAGKYGPFLGILTHTPDFYTRTGVVQVAGLAKVSVSAGVGAYLMMEDGKIKVGNIKNIGSDNYIGNVVSLDDNVSGKPIANVLLRSWCGELGHACLDGYVPCSALGAEPRVQGKQKFIGGIAHVKGTSLKGVPFVNYKGVQNKDGSITFQLDGTVTNCHAQAADAHYKVNIRYGEMTVSKRMEIEGTIETDIYMFVTVK